MAANVLQKAVGSSPTELTDSQVVDDGTGVGIGTSSPSATLHVQSQTQQLRVSYDASNYLSVAVSPSGQVDVNAAGSAKVFVVYLAGTERMRVTDTGVLWDVNVVPKTDNTYTCGGASFRWSLVRGVTITSGDLRFENDFVLTEHYNVGDGVPRGIGLVDDRVADNPKLLAFFADDGTIFSGSVRPLSELPGRVHVRTTVERTSRTPDELAELNK